jgi:hypothetical protein
VSATSGYGIGVFDQHAELLAASAIDPEVARARGYVSVDVKTRLEALGFSKVQRRVPGLLIPVHGITGEVVTYEYRPDVPRVTDAGKTIKYEKPYGTVNRLDVHPRTNGWLADPAVTLWVAEGARKVDAAVTAGLCCVGISGVYGWRSTDTATGGKVALPEWESVALNGRAVVLAFDADARTNGNVAQALARFRRFLESRGAHVRVVVIPDLGDGKTGLDDYLAAGLSVDDLEVLDSLHEDEQRDGPTPREPPPPAEPRTLDNVLATFAKHLSLPDTIAVRAVLGAYAAHRLPGDPVWLLAVGGSGRGKTEIVCALEGIADTRAAAVLTEAALLSGTSRRERAAHATGGLLRELGDSGVLILKDFTSILSQHREQRAQVLAALRELYDGKWTRHLGVDGGQSLEWSGKLGVLGAVTTILDRAYAVMGIMGERFLLVRLPVDSDRALAFAALKQVGHETAMRAELGAAVRGLFARPLLPAPARSNEETERLVTLAQLVARGRSPVERDYQGALDLILDPEAPTRVVKCLAQLWNGLHAIGDPNPWEVVARVGLDSIPKLRRAVLDALADGEQRDTTWVRLAVDHPKQSTTRALEELVAHQLATRRSPGPGKADQWRLTEWTVEALAVAGAPKMSGTTVPGPAQATTPNAERDAGSYNPIPAYDDNSGAPTWEPHDDDLGAWCSDESDDYDGGVA